MKRWPLVLLALVICPGLVAQSAAANKMSLGFTTVALKALRSISLYSGGSQPSPVGVIQEMEDLARTKGEIAAAALLRNYLRDKMKNNEGREYAVDHALTAWDDAHPEPRSVPEDASLQDRIAADGNRDLYERQKGEARFTIRREVLSREVFLTMDEREVNCRAAADAILRSGVFRRVNACDIVAVSMASYMQLH